MECLYYELPNYSHFKLKDVFPGTEFISIRSKSLLRLFLGYGQSGHCFLILSSDNIPIAGIWGGEKKRKKASKKCKVAVACINLNFWVKCVVKFAYIVGNLSKNVQIVKSIKYVTNITFFTSFIPSKFSFRTMWAKSQ